MASEGRRPERVARLFESLLIMKFPIILDANGDVDLFSSVSKAESSVEYIDVNNYVYVGYDAEGRLLRIYSVGYRVFFELAEDEPHHAADLAFALRRFLLALGTPSDHVNALTLEGLVELAFKIKGT